MYCSNIKWQSWLRQKIEITLGQLMVHNNRFDPVELIMPVLEGKTDQKLDETSTFSHPEMLIPILQRRLWGLLNANPPTFSLEVYKQVFTTDMLANSAFALEVKIFANIWFWKYMKRDYEEVLQKIKITKSPEKIAQEVALRYGPLINTINMQVFIQALTSLVLT